MTDRNHVTYNTQYHARQVDLYVQPRMLDSSRILNVEQGTFTPFVLSATEGMGRECSMFFEKLSQLISIKRNEKLSVVTYGIRCKIIFATKLPIMYTRESKVK